MDTRDLRAGFVGGGRVARVLVGGWRAGHALPGTILVQEPADAAYEQLVQVAPMVQRSSLAEVAGADVVFLALHPPALAQALPSVAPLLAASTTVVSLAPRIPLGALVSGLGSANVARMIPNAPSIVGKGYNPVCFGPDVDADSRARLLRLAEPWGPSPEVPEAHLEAYAVLTGMGPTYYWFQWDLLRVLAGEFGLPPDATAAALQHMIAGAAATLLESGLPAGTVMDLVPIRPLEGIEAQVAEAYFANLRGVYAKIRPSVV
jgi:pyrroline-5-carboxylate reductase